jgi:hypothetical protein
MNILLIDIETSPNLGYVWQLWNQNIGLSELAESGEMICFAAKWYRQPRIEFYSKWSDGLDGMSRNAWRLLDQADAVVHYNGKRFDVPWLQRGFLEFGMTPPSPFKQIDLLEVVRKQFRFPSNKLAYVSERLGVGGKVKHEGFDLWLKVMTDDTDARRRMRIYNMQDVKLLEPLYDKLQPWIPGHPSYGALEGMDVCPKCGSDALVREGYAYTASGKFQRFKCGNCGAWSRSSKRDDHTSIVQVAA